MNALRALLGLFRHVAVWLLLLPIRFYQLAISPYTPPSCRFTPSCSEYARHQAWSLQGLGLGRLACVEMQSVGR